MTEDITERKLAEAALRASELEARTLAMVASRTDNAVILTDSHGLVEWINDGFTRLTGYGLDEVVGRKPGNILQGPGTKDVDFSVFKNITLHEAKTLQLRSEFFNLFNTPQFNNPNSTVGGGFGTITSAGSPVTLQRISREIQLAAKYSF